ncbi:MAG: 50S ribosomal protein L25 [Syntrophomonas sp.]|nr:50S ribosomal protein L25 [Syntrophomonas sp.]
MASIPVLEAKIRPIKNAGYLKELKRQEGVPAVIYGRGKDNLNIVLDRKNLTKTFNRMGINGVFSLEIEGKPASVAQVREVQKDHISGHITHVDFLTVAMDEKINSMIRIHLLGEEEVSQSGAVLQTLMREIPVSSLPGDLPEVITFDVSGLTIGNKVVIGDLDIPDNIEVLEDLDTTIANIVATREEEVAEEEVVEEEVVEEESE